MEIDAKTTLNSIESSTNASGSCLHCQAKLEPSRRQSGFCCQGCSVAYQFINSLGLNQFYTLNQNTLLNQVEEDIVQKNYEIYNVPQFQSKFVVHTKRGESKALLIIDGLSCYACIWLIQKAIKKQFDLDIQINLSSGASEFVFDPKTHALGEIVATIERLGFRCQPDTGLVGKTVTNDLIRIGVGFFCFMNTMLLSVPDYFNSDLIHDPEYWNLFRYISLGFSIIVMGYVAQPFYRTSWTYLKNKRISIDQPIVVAVVITFLYSAINTIRQNGPVYFDSIASILAFLLAGRYFQKIMMIKAEKAIQTTWQLANPYMREAKSNKLVELGFVKKGELFSVLPGEAIQVDSEVVEGQSEIQYEQITGEAEPLVVTKGATIKAGAVNLNSRLCIRAREDGSNSFISKIDGMAKGMLSGRGAYVKFTDRMASIFFAGIFTAALSAFIYFLIFSTAVVAFERSVALLLIACPCAFGIAVPLTMASAMARGLKKGVALKSHRAIEKLAALKTLYFDKTGTLTIGKPIVSKVTWFSECLESLKLNDTIIYQWMRQFKQYSNHHHSQAASHYAELCLKEMDITKSNQSFYDFLEVFGKGIHFKCNGHVIHFGNEDYCSSVLSERGKQLIISTTNLASETLLVVDGLPLAKLTFSDEVYHDAREVVDYFKGQQISLEIVSGDVAKNTHAVAQKLDIPIYHAKFQKNPVEKADYISQQNKKNDSWLTPYRDRATAMVGNGFNDSLALLSADIGIVVAKGNQVAKDAADIYLFKEGLSGLKYGYKLAKKAKTKIAQSFLFASLYNFLGLYLALSGRISPAIAAVLMPVSSAVVILISTIWSQKDLK